MLFMQKILAVLSASMICCFSSVSLLSCSKPEKKIENKIGEFFDLTKLNQNLFVKLQQIVYDQKDGEFKVQIFDLKTVEVEQFPYIIKENIKWLISLNSLKITNKERVKILNSPLDQNISGPIFNNQTH